MKFKEKIAIRILLLIAEWFVSEPSIKKEINAISTHISVCAKEETPQ